MGAVSFVPYVSPDGLDHAASSLNLAAIAKEALMDAMRAEGISITTKGRKGVAV